ncbi:MAG TPA: DUF6282 family protein [Pseudonocardiaceae bacterium]|nr:DUF6282 family protein [Pseudonocardiaceae bacterium]
MTMSAADAVAASRELLAGTIDMHVHTAPDVVPRSATAIDVGHAAKAAGMRAVVLKSHSTDTASRAETASELTGFPLIGGVVLNHAVGGLNPDAVRESARQGGRVVWLPTASARHYLEHTRDRHHPRYESWLARGLVVSEGGEIRPETEAVLRAVQRTDMVLCSGHVSPAETLTTFRRAAELGIRRLVVTHPHADFVGATVPTMREFAEVGAVNEMLYTFVTPAVEHTQTMAHIAGQIRETGIENCYISTDGGQAVNPVPTEMYRLFIEGLLLNDFTEKEIIQLARTTPARVLFG